jgi:hypothetical protein
MATRHSSVVGGSTADRVLHCPASYQETIALPASIDATSPYAEEGTHLHHVMDELMRARQINNDLDLKILASGYVGEHFYDREFSAEHLEAAIEPALDQLAALEREYGGGFIVVGVEKEVRFPGIPGAFGTADLLLQSSTHLILVDWKFGSGVPVKAIYLANNGDEHVNAQLLFYLTGAYAGLRRLFKNRDIVGAIIQPRTDDPLTHAVIAPVELATFAQDLETAVIEAMSRDPYRERGEHCRFAPCKLTCPLWTGPLLDLSALRPIVRTASDVQSREPTAYGAYLSAAKLMLDTLLVLKPTIDEQIHAFLEAGGLVPGWKLKAKTKQRAWVDETMVVPVLKKLGFSDSDIWQKKLQTFAAADAAAKRLGVTIPANLRVAPPTNETTIAAIDDPAPAVEHARAVANFSTALKKLKPVLCRTGSNRQSS